MFFQQIDSEYNDLISQITHSKTNDLGGIYDKLEANEFDHLLIFVCSAFNFNNNY